MQTFIQYLTEDGDVKNRIESVASPQHHSENPFHQTLTKHGYNHVKSYGGSAMGNMPADKTEANHRYEKEGHSIHVHTGKNDHMKTETSWRHTKPGSSFWHAAGKKATALDKHLSGETGVHGVRYK